MKIHSYLHISTANPLVPIQNHSLPPGLLNASKGNLHSFLTSADLAIFYAFYILKVFFKIFMALTKFIGS